MNYMDWGKRGKGNKPSDQLWRMFIKLGRLVVPSASTQVLIGQVCHKLRSSGKLDPVYPRIYNDVAIALLARQIGALLVTVNLSDFQTIHQVVDFRFRKVMES